MIILYLGTCIYQRLEPSEFIGIGFGTGPPKIK